MSKAATATAPLEGEAAPKKKNKLILIVGIAVLVLALVGGGAAFMLSKKKVAEDGDEADAESSGKPAKTAHAKGKDKHGAPPTFVSMDAFTVNLLPESGEQYLQVVCSLKLEDAHVAEELKVYMPELRHRVLMLLSGKKASELQGIEGRETLAEEIMSASNEVLGYGSKAHGKSGKDPEGKAKKEPVEGPVVAVLFTSFIIQ